MSAFTSRNYDSIDAALNASEKIRDSLIEHSSLKDRQNKIESLNKERADYENKLKVLLIRIYPS